MKVKNLSIEEQRIIRYKDSIVQIVIFLIKKIGHCHWRVVDDSSFVLVHYRNEVMPGYCLLLIAAFS